MMKFHEVEEAAFVMEMSQRQKPTANFSNVPVQHPLNPQDTNRIHVQDDITGKTHRKLRTKKSRNLEGSFPSRNNHHDNNDSSNYAAVMTDTTHKKSFSLFRFRKNRKNANVHRKQSNSNHITVATDSRNVERKGKPDESWKDSNMRKIDPLPMKNQPEQQHGTSQCEPQEEDEQEKDHDDLYGHMGEETLQANQAKTPTNIYTAGPTSATPKGRNVSSDLNTSFLSSSNTLILESYQESIELLQTGDTLKIPTLIDPMMNSITAAGATTTTNNMHHHSDSSSTTLPTTDSTVLTTTSTTSPCKLHLSEKLLFIRSALSRPFGRASLPPQLGKRWCVDVSHTPTDFDPTEGPYGRWKYTIHVRENPSLQHTSSSMSHDMHDTVYSITSCKRSLLDFLWLESALQVEYDGALIPPLLAMTITSAMDWTSASVTDPVTTSTMSQNDHHDLLSLSGIKNVIVSAAASIHTNNTTAVTTKWTNSVDSLQIPLFEQGLWDPLTWSNKVWKDLLENKNQLKQRDHHNQSHQNDHNPRIQPGSEEDRARQLHGRVLADWLSDILNGIRGKGEILLPSKLFDRNSSLRSQSSSGIMDLSDGKDDVSHNSGVIDVTQSDALEIFLYRNLDPVFPIPQDQVDYRSKMNWSTDSLLGMYFRDEKKRQSFVEANNSRLAKLTEMVHSSSQTRSFLDIMLQNNCMGTASPYEEDPWKIALSSCSNSSVVMANNPVEKTVPNTCICAESVVARRAIVHDAIGRYHFPRRAIRSNSIFPSLLTRRDSTREFLEAQGYVTVIQRETTLRAMYRLRLLLEHELVVSAAWKRFAISLSNLFASEKDVEKSSIGSTNSGDKDRDRSSSPKGKFTKATIEDNLRVYAKQKCDRSIPSLRVLSSVLYAHHSDLCAIESSLFAMCEANHGGEGCRDSTSDFTNINNSSITINAVLIESRLRQVNQAMKLRNARMAWKYFKVEAGQAALLNSSASSLSKTLEIEVVSHDDERELDTFIEQEESLLKQMLELTEVKQPESRQADYDNNFLTKLEEMHRVLKESEGIWSPDVSRRIMHNVGVDYYELKSDQFSSDVKAVRKLTNGLRESLNRCYDSLDLLEDCVVGRISNLGDEPFVKNKSSDNSTLQLAKMRLHFFSSMALLFSGPLNSARVGLNTSRWLHDFVPTPDTLQRLGIDIKDTSGWSSAFEFSSLNKAAFDGELRLDGCSQCGETALNYFQKVRERETVTLLNQFRHLLHEYERRILQIESYMHMCSVGIHLEKHFSKLRADAVAAWEKKTDIITAINVASKKRLDIVVQELESKLEQLDSSVSHAGVKEAKEKHLASKTIKSELETLALGKLKRLKDICGDKVLEVIRCWAKYEQRAASEEMMSLMNIIREIELSITEEDIRFDGGSHLFASMAIGSPSFTSKIKSIHCPQAR